MKPTTALFLALTLPLFAVTEARADAIRLAVGEVRQVPISPSVGLIVDAPQVLDVKLLSSGQVKLVARSEGVARVQLFPKNGKGRGQALRVRVSGKRRSVASAMVTSTEVP